jgi:iron(III)-salmochelin esterase
VEGVSNRSAPGERAAARSVGWVWLALLLAIGSGCERRTAPALGVASEPDAPLEAEGRALAHLADALDGTPAGIGAERRELTWTFDEGAFGPSDVVISIPADASDAKRYPVLVALHGRGESLKGRRRGARGWLDDYDLRRAMARLREPPLVENDFQGFVSEQRLREINGSLREQPYADLIIVCPYLPDVLRRENAFKEADALAAFIVDALLPRVYDKTPAIGTPASTGIDGVSLGGRAALLVAFTRPLAFGALEALQAAIDGSEIERFAELGARALATNPKLLLRLLTSEQDHFLSVNQRLSAELERRRVQHRYLRVLGTHSYRFNRGPGSLEMLLYHDRALRGLSWN